MRHRDSTPIAAVPVAELGPLPRVRVVARGVMKLDGAVEICRRCRRALAVPDSDHCGRCMSASGQTHAGFRERSGPPPRPPRPVDRRRPQR